MSTVHVMHLRSNWGGWGGPEAILLSLATRADTSRFRTSLVSFRDQAFPKNSLYDEARRRGLMVELLLTVSGFPFAELAKDAATVTVRGEPVRVGRLTKLLQSKQLAGRAKDRQFLRRYQALLENKGG